MSRQLAEEADQVDGPEHHQDERDDDRRRVLARAVALDQQIGVVGDDHRRHGVDGGNLGRRQRPGRPLAGANDEAAGNAGGRHILQLDLDRLAGVADLDVLGEISDGVQRRLGDRRRELHDEGPALRRLGRRRERTGIGRGRRGLRLDGAERPHHLAAPRGERAAGVVLGDEPVARQADPRLIGLGHVDGNRLPLVERHGVTAGVDQRQRRPGVASGERARQGVGREEVRGRDMRGEVAANRGGERQVVDADEPPLEDVRLGQRRRQRALAAVEEQPVAGPEDTEELAEDPGPLGVNLQRALPIGEPGHPDVAVLETVHRPAVAKHGAGAAEVKRIPRRQRITQVVADVKDEEERQQRARHGDHRMAATRMRDVCELVDDACRVTGGSVGLGRIGHVSGVAAQPSTGSANYLKPLVRLALQGGFRYVRRVVRVRSRVLVALALVALPMAAAGCGHKSKTPEEAFQRFATAVQAGDGAALFEALDQQTRWDLMTIQKYHREAVRHRAQQLSRRARARPGEGAVRARGHAPPRRRSSSAATRRPALADAGAAGARDSAHRARPRRRQATAVVDGGGRVPLLRGESGGWGFAGLAKRAEDDKNRAYNDLEAVRASAADYERAAARAAK